MKPFLTILFLTCLAAMGQSNYVYSYSESVTNETTNSFGTVTTVTNVTTTYNIPYSYLIYTNQIVGLTNISAPLKLQPEDWYDTKNHQPTNMIIGNNYAGTLQVEGESNYYRLTDETNSYTTKQLNQIKTP